VRKLEKKKGIHIAVVADLQGPKLRVGEFATGKVLLKEGDEFLLDMDPKLGTDKRVCLPHKEIFQAIKPGDELLLDDGNIVLTIKKNDSKTAVTKVKYGGYLSSHKGVNLPNIQLPISAITEKDREDLKFALKMGADYVSLSFVQRADDVKEAKKLVGDKAWIISKLEKPSAIDDLDEIIQLSDAIMVARGDLGVECPVQDVPVLQKRIVGKCREYGRPVIVATQMLDSMINNPSPTRAEVSDVATAVYDGADTVMLSGETAAGKYPVEAVKMMANIIKKVESDELFLKIMEKTRKIHCCMNESDAITYAATHVADVLSRVSAIVTYTTSGLTTLLQAKERPSLPILAVTPDINVARRLGIVWGTTSYINSEKYSSFEKIEEISIKLVKKEGYAKSGDHILITAGFPLHKAGRTNILHIVQIP
jgi:pyruvate kinase